MMIDENYYEMRYQGREDQKVSCFDCGETIMIITGGHIECYRCARVINNCDGFELVKVVSINGK